MLTKRGLFAACVVVAFAGCSDSNISVSTDPGLRADQAGNGTPPAATGGGHYDVAGLIVQFAFSAVAQPDGRAAGQFHIQADEGGGLFIDVSGAVTCLAVDSDNHRAWIGGVVTRNTSSDPDLPTDIHQPGRDIWFRVLDSGEGGGAIDRTTFTGFKGAAGIETSVQYCAARLWPADNARTWPVTGNISVRP